MEDVKKGVSEETSQGRKSKKKGSGSNKNLLGHDCKGLTAESECKTLALKVYEEQLPEGVGIADCIVKLKTRINGISKSDYQVLAILHDADYNRDDIKNPTPEKPHIHIIIRSCKKNKSDGRVHGVRVRTILNMLGIEFRDEDESLWRNHGVESVYNFSKYSLYLTHDTEDAEHDGKHKYDVAAIISNLTPEEVDQVRAGYLRVSNSAGKVTYSDMAELDKLAEQAGYDLLDFDEWKRSYSLAIRSNNKMRVVKESYEHGVKRRMEEMGEVNRICIFIQGAPNSGKTTTSEMALRAIGIREVLKVGGGGSGKFDDLKPTTQAILVDDDVVPSILAMTDNKIRKAYRRQSNNPYWAGQWYVVTSNLSFKDWLEACNIKTQNYVVVNATTRRPGEPPEREYRDSPHYKACLSRFFVCHLEDRGGHTVLYCDTWADRGTPAQQLERKQKYIDFRNAFNSAIYDYQPKIKTVDYSDINAF